jgi:hypothetical protein
LEKFRNSTNVQYELDQINQEQKENTSDESISLWELCTLKELRWPLITSLVIQMSQQLCGINAVSVLFWK